MAQAADAPQREKRRGEILVAAGRLVPVVDDVLPLSDVAEAHRRIEAREVFGKLVLQVGENR